MLETLKDLEILLVLQIFELGVEDSCDELLMSLIAVAMDHLQSQLNRVRPSNMYPPAGFYPTGSDDDFWIQHADLFKHKFRFRLDHFKRIINAIGFIHNLLRVGQPRNEINFEPIFVS